MHPQTETNRYNREREKRKCRKGQSSIGLCTNTKENNIEQHIYNKQEECLDNICKENKQQRWKRKRKRQGNEKNDLK